MIVPQGFRYTNNTYIGSESLYLIPTLGYLDPYRHTEVMEGNLILPVCHSGGRLSQHPTGIGGIEAWCGICQEESTSRGGPMHKNPTTTERKSHILNF